MYWYELKSVLRRGLLGFCFLAISQIIMQIKIIGVLRSVFKSTSLFEIVQEKRVFLYFLYDRESMLFLSAGGSFSYATPGSNTRILLIPWILNGTMQLMSTSYFSFRSTLTIFGTEDFWSTVLLILFIILVKALLLYEVFLKLMNGVLRWNFWRQEPMAIVVWKGSQPEPQILDPSFGVPTHISDDEDF